MNEFLESAKRETGDSEIVACSRATRSRGTMIAASTSPSRTFFSASARLWTRTGVTDSYSLLA